jgi:hypothetical protein
MPELIKEKIITVDRVEGAIDYIEWKTNKGEKKSTNRIDDIIHLTPMGEEYVKEIEAGKKKDKLCWQWTMFCAGDGNNCQRECEVLVAVKKIVQIVAFQIILKITMICIFARCVLYLNQNYPG